MPDVAMHVRFWRRYRGLTQAELARRATISLSALTKIEAGHARPHIRTLRRLATALEISIVELMPDCRDEPR